MIEDTKIDDKPDITKTKKKLGGLLIGFVCALVLGVIIWLLLTVLKPLLAIILGVFMALLFIASAIVIVAYYFRTEISQYLFKGIDASDFKGDIKSAISLIVEDFVNSYFLFLSTDTKKSIKVVVPKVLFMLLWSFFRSKTLLIIISLAFAIFGTINNYLVYEQNVLLEKQNEEGVKQTIVEDANSEKNKINLVINLLEKINHELEDNEQRKLSKALIKDIINLSSFLKPYKKIDRSEGGLEDALLSPERGLLLAMLISKEIAVSTYDSIYANAVFSYADLEGMYLENAYLRGINLRYANLENTNLKNATLDKANLEAANLFRTHLEHASLDFVDLKKGKIQGAWLDSTSLRGAYLEGARIDSTSIRYGDLLGVSLRTASINFTDLYHSMFYSSDLSYATIKNSNLDSTMLKDGLMEYIRIEESSIQNSDLSDAKLNDATLKFSILDKSILEESTLSFAKLETCEMVQTQLNGVDFRKAILDAVNFEKADFTNAKHITYDQFITVKSLKSAENFPNDIKSQIKQSHPMIVE